LDDLALRLFVTSTRRRSHALAGARAFLDPLRPA
jgi:hypothetical protein